MCVTKVHMRADAYLVCLHHALTTEREEVLGLLVGQFIPTDDEVVCDIYSAVTLRRSDKRKDRVEISPEMLIEAQQKAEHMSASSGGQELHIVGWYHSHPHITVWPSDIDLQTQAGYQQMDKRFIGLIFSVYNEDKKSKIGSEQVTCFQATNQTSNGKPSQWMRVAVPLSIVPSSSLAVNNQQALESLVTTLYEEQSEVLKLSREKMLSYPLAHLHNSSVMVKSVCGISRLVTGPLVACTEKSLVDTKRSILQLQEEAAYLKKILRKNEIDIQL